jgi:hypothetical protein
MVAGAAGTNVLFHAYLIALRRSGKKIFMTFRAC